jgi:hypothetical protein
VPRPAQLGDNGLRDMMMAVSHAWAARRCGRAVFHPRTVSGATGPRNGGGPDTRRSVDPVIASGR